MDRDTTDLVGISSELVKTYLYIIFNKLSNKYYIGITNNFERRLREHNFKNTHYTGRIKGEWVLVYKKEFSNYTQAKKEETRLKKAKNKKYLEWYINNN